MKFITFRNPNGEQCGGWLSGDGVVDMQLAGQGKLPFSIRELLVKHETYMPLIHSIEKDAQPNYSIKEIELMAPLPNPCTFRDFVAFETHVKNASATHDSTVAPEWYEVPIFYFSNPNAMRGPGEEVARPKKCVKLDYELEMACIIGKEGKNIQAREAEEYIFGYTILNDWSARDLQAQELKVLLGPAKGKDFATSIGPWIVTKDELLPYKIDDRFDLEMTAKVNGEVWSHGNFKDIYYSFGQMIERASEDVTLYPGDIIGSGTVGFGCILELGTEEYRWLEQGDEIELEITGLGVLKSRIV
ncbi:fumarylacetoacetate hydrolase family protein [Neobacillus sp. SuZ13]|uniref:fumarylacetoacetate hydrolase family protein n=1 Tax=Neobacillus sp. SuZ13 TaxID=3047875 RepID=UPI0024C02382|nr:fumarylacetoacetate hydrolase family protein [Neobacillus sp. SuZ13]WHY69068.1 fumarylacetoacetate hydrolase family protein [Neobacillus sp. SuZ13]